MNAAAFLPSLALFTLGLGCGTPLQSGSPAPTQPQRDFAVTADASIPPAPVVDEPWRSTPPPVPGLLKYTPPSIQRTVLRNGMAVFLLEDHSVHYVALELSVRAGAAADPTNKSGLANLVASIVSEGPSTTKAQHWAAEVEATGSTIVPTVAADSSTFALEVLPEDASSAVRLLAGMVRDPGLSAESIKRAKASTLSALQTDAANARTQSERSIRSAMFGKSPLGRVPQGIAGDVAALSMRDIIDFWRRHYFPQACAIVVVGDIDVPSTLKLIDTQFGSWSSPRTTTSSAEKAVKPEAQKQAFYIQDMPNEQVELAVGLRLDDVQAHEWAPLLVLNNIYSGVYASRLNVNLREEKGLTYNARSRIIRSRSGSLLLLRASIATGKSGLAIKEIFKEMDGIVSSPPDDSELQRFKSVTMQSIAARFDTRAAAASTIAELFALGLPDNYYIDLASQIESLTASDVIAVAKKYLNKNRLYLIAVGPSPDISQDWASLGLPTAEVIPGGK